MGSEGKDVMKTFTIGFFIAMQAEEWIMQNAGIIQEFGGEEMGEVGVGGHQVKITITTAEEDYQEIKANIYPDGQILTEEER